MEPTLKARVEEVMRITGWDVSRTAEIAGVTPSAVSQWLGKSKKKTVGSIGKMEAAERIEAATGFAALWVAKGVGPKMAGGQPFPAPPGASEERAEMLKQIGAWLPGLPAAVFIGFYNAIKNAAESLPPPTQEPTLRLASPPAENHGKTPPQ